MKKKGLIIDTNLLLLLIVGALGDGQYIRSSKRLSQYTVEDYDIVARWIGGFDQIYITPYIAAEVSNLIDLHGNARIHAFEMARTLFLLFEEVETGIHDDVSGKEFLNYGLADASLVKLAKDYCILTADNRLAAHLVNVNPDNTFPYYLAKQGM